jgi:hypothetical protein
MNFIKKLIGEKNDKDSCGVEIKEGWSRIQKRIQKW